ncbi:putative prokaryotic membrane lipoprotein [Faustovirus]|nr:putative prokaryotic membrane lipoprotein [Faustovirus]QJX73423.1 putative prokaryotic membrane lipoprotein [Faustovirus]
MSDRKHVMMRNVIKCMPTLAVTVMIGPTAWFSCDTMAALLASSDDFEVVYQRYIDQYGVNYEGVKTAASLGNLRILERTFSLPQLTQSGKDYENVVVATVVGAARTVNLRTIYWLDIKAHFKVFKTYATSNKVIRDVALSTHNAIFIEKCLERFTGDETLLRGVENFDTMMRLRKYVGGKLSRFPAGGITTDTHLKHCETLTNGELHSLFINCAWHERLDTNLRFARYFVDRCELEYPKLRIPWRYITYKPLQFMIEMLNGRNDRMQADCVSCIFYTLSYQSKYKGDYNNSKIDWSIVRQLITTGFKWHFKLKHIVGFLRLHRADVYESGIYELLTKYEKNKYCDN